MKKGYHIILILTIILMLTGCGSENERIEENAPQDVIQDEVQLEQSDEPLMIAESGEPDEIIDQETEVYEEEVENLKMKLQVGEHSFTVTMAENSSAEALLDMLKQGPLSIDMQDYANMEKVGPIGTSLPRNDEQITTEAGDIILYQGNALVIYYAPNSWSFTRLGRIDDVTQKELKEVLGESDVTVTLFLD